MDVRRALTDTNLFGDFTSGGSWSPWRTILAAAFGLPLDEAERATFERLTGRTTPPADAVEELWVIAGRRGGKTRAAAILAAYLAALRDYRKVLAPGERATVLFLAQNQRQARVAFGYAAAAFDHSKLLAKMVQNRSTDTLALTNGANLEVRAASFRGLRGLTLAAVVADEVAYWFDVEGGSANPAAEILDAVRPGLATTGGPLVSITSPYRRSGVVWDAYRQHHGQDSDPILTVRAPSRELNPTLPQRVIDRAMQRDESAARAEYLAEFRSDLEGFLDSETVDAAVDEDRPLDLPPREDLAYRAFVDMSGGRQDASALAIAHTEGETAVVDVIRGRRPPFDPETVVEDFAKVCRDYHIATVTGDAYAGEWVARAFERHGLRYQRSSLPASRLYLEALPLFTRGLVRLPRHERTLRELRNLERRTSRGGRDVVDHPQGGHDDHANVVAGVLHTVAERREPPTPRIMQL